MSARSTFLEGAHYLAYQLSSLSDCCRSFASTEIIACIYGVIILEDGLGFLMKIFR